MECRVGVVQMITTADKEDNIRRAKAAIEKAAREGAELVILPEMFCVPYDTSLFSKYAEEEGGEAQTMLSHTAEENGIYLIGGSICERDGAGKLYNTSYVYNPRGECITKHRKYHLFDISIKNGVSFKESDVLSAGEEITIFDTPWGKIGLGICFDIRFSDMAREMVTQGAKILVYPAAFNKSTGPLHWELLFRARAMDGQCFTIGVAPARQENVGYVSWAHSMIVNPWGRVLFDAGTEEKVVLVDIDLNEVADVRAQIPLGWKGA